MPFARVSSSIALKTILLGVGLSAAAAWGWDRWIRAEATARIAHEATELEARIAARIEGYLALLRGATGLFAAHPDASRQEFRRYVAGMGLEQNYPGVQGIGFSLRVASGEAEKVEMLARLSGMQGFKIWPEGARPEYHTILYLEPQDERNRAAMGYDMFTEPVRRSAMQRATESGQPAATGKVTLVQEIDARKQPGFLIYMPFYRGGQTPETEAERRATLIGFVYAPFRAADFIAAIAAWGTAERVDVAIYDGYEQNAAALLFQQTRLTGAARARAVTQTRGR